MMQSWWWSGSVRPRCKRRGSVARSLLERIARALASDGSFALAASLFDRSPGEEQTKAILAGIEKGLEGRALAAVPESLRPMLEKRWERPDRDVELIRFAVRLGSEEAYREALRIAGDAKAPQNQRTALIELIGQVTRPEGREVLLTILGRDEPGGVLQAALNALGSYGQPEVADAILARYRKVAGIAPGSGDRPARQPQGLGVAVARCHDGGTISPKDLTSSQAAQIARLGDEELTSKLTRIWGALPSPNSEAKRQRIAEVRGILPEGDKGDPARGAGGLQADVRGLSYPVRRRREDRAGSDGDRAGGPHIPA